MNGPGSRTAAPSGTAYESEVIEAVVQVGEQETRYLRYGRTGPALVLLAPAGAGREQLVRELGQCHRVVAPMIPESLNATSAEAVVCWLLDVVDGLGIDDPLILVSGDADTRIRHAVDSMERPLRVGEVPVCAPDSTTPDHPEGP